MSFSKQLGTSLAISLDELCVADDLNLPLNEIRDPDRLQALIAKLGKSDHPSAADRLNRLQALHDRKTASLERRAHRQRHVDRRQHEIATKHGYRRLSKGNYIHAKTGDRLSFENGKWTHMKTKQTQNTNGKTPLRALQRHLKTLHKEAVEPERLMESPRLHALLKKHGYEQIRSGIGHPSPQNNFQPKHPGGSLYVTPKGRTVFVTDDGKVESFKTFRKKRAQQMSEEELQEIRAVERLRKEINNLTLHAEDPVSLQKLSRLRYLHDRKVRNALSKLKGA